MGMPLSPEAKRRRDILDTRWKLASILQDAYHYMASVSGEQDTFDHSTLRKRLDLYDHGVEAMLRSRDEILNIKLVDTLEELPFIETANAFNSDEDLRREAIKATKAVEEWAALWGVDAPNGKLVSEKWPIVTHAAHCTDPRKCICTPTKVVG